MMKAETAEGGAVGLDALVGRLREIAAGFNPWTEEHRHLTKAAAELERLQKARGDWQARCIELGFQYWRAPDAHGVTCTQAQALELLCEVLGVEVDWAPNAD